MKTLNIFVCCHKDFEFTEITNPIYKLISDKEIKNASSLEFVKSDGKLDNRMWSELSQIYFVWKNLELSDYVGFCHYRRYFEFMNEIPSSIDKPVIPKPIGVKYNNYIAYDIYHSGRDLLKCANIIEKDFPEYHSAYITMMDLHIQYSFNMFIMNKELFNEYCEFVFGVLLKLDEIYKIDNSYENMLKRIGNLREHYLEKAAKPNNTYEYQARLYGFLAERLTTVFFIKYMSEHGKDSVVEIPVKEIES